MSYTLENLSYTYFGYVVYVLCVVVYVVFLLTTPFECSLGYRRLRFRQRREQQRRQQQRRRQQRRQQLRRRHNVEGVYVVLSTLCCLRSCSLRSQRGTYTYIALYVYVHFLLRREQKKRSSRQVRIRYFSVLYVGKKPY